MSTKIKIEFPEQDGSSWGQVVLSPACPFNLLGRDFMAKMKIAIYPGENGGMVACQYAEAYVIQGSGEPHYYWSLDLPTVDVAGTAKQFADLTAEVTRRPKSISPPGGYHVTVRFKKTTGPDYAFDKAFCRLGPQRVVLTACYWKEDNCFCLCTLTPEMNKLVQYGKTPHLSMAINGLTDWKHLNQLYRHYMSKTSLTGDLMSRKAGSSALLLVTCSPQTHLEERSA